MEHSIIRYILFALCIGGMINASATTLTLSDGSQIEGEISKVFKNQVTITGNDGTKSEHSFSKFDSSSKTVIKEWKSSNPHKVDVYNKFDSQPVVKSSLMPQIPYQLRNGDFNGTASVELTLDATGRVIHASIARSTHPELETASIEATKEWEFEPAYIHGRAVKSKLRVPFNFSYTAPQDTVMETLAPYTKGDAFQL